MNNKSCNSCVHNEVCKIHAGKNGVKIDKNASDCQYYDEGTEVVLEEYTERFFDNGERCLCGYCRSKQFRKIAVDGQQYYQCRECGAVDPIDESKV